MTDLSFEQADELFRQSQLNTLTASDAGFRFLLLRSMSRSDLLKKLATNEKISTDSVSAKNLLKFIFESPISIQNIKRFINAQFKNERKTRQKNEARLIHELYQIKEFDWGGLHQNNLEKNIVDHYVKKIDNYCGICHAVDEKLYPSLRAYTLCSWYNHWSSLIIEDIFRDHPAVTPAIGKIKQVDFFIENVPYDLKVTRFPEEYIALQRKKSGLRPELTILKKVCRQFSLPIPKDFTSSRLLEDLWRKAADHPAATVQQIISDLKKFRVQLLEKEKKDPASLIKWYYENQGERRFDASNRLFLILVDSTDFFNSWQLKRAKDLIQKEVHSALSNIASKSERVISFQWNGSNYSVQSELVFVVK